MCFTSLYYFSREYFALGKDSFVWVRVNVDSFALVREHYVQKKYGKSYCTMSNDFFIFFYKGGQIKRKFRPCL